MTSTTFSVYFLWYLVITAGFVACIATLALIWFRFPERTANDVVDFLLPVDLEKLAALLDPETEANLRRGLSREEFRRIQRKRIHLCIALFKRMAHNAAVLVDWANREAVSKEPHTAELARDLQQIAVGVRLYCLATLLKLRFWQLIRLDAWRILPLPYLCEAGEIHGVRGVEYYDRLKSAASFLFLERNHSRFEELMQNL
jgi:hypothetical protein